MDNAIRIPRHIAFIPDGNRRWAEQQGLPKHAGYAAGVEPGVRLFEHCRSLGVEEISAYGFTKENVRRAGDQVNAFRQACVDFALAALDAGAALLAVGDAESPLFPKALLPFAGQRSPGAVRCNLIVNYNWQWDLNQLHRNANRQTMRRSALSSCLGSADVSVVDLVVRWGGRRRLSGLLPVQCAYADIYVIDSLWPDMTLDEVRGALHWYSSQDVTLGG